MPQTIAPPGEHLVQPPEIRRFVWSPGNSAPDAVGVEPDSAPRLLRRDRVETTSALLGSFLVHLVIMLVLGLVIFRGERDTLPDLILQIDELAEMSTTEVAIATPAPGVGPIEREPVDFAVPEDTPSKVSVSVATDPENEPEENSIPPETDSSDKRSVAGEVGALDLLAPTGLPTGGGLEGRHHGRKQQLLLDRGGTPESEAAVLRGLRWIAAQQGNHGGWTFGLSEGACGGHCTGSGAFPSTTAATALALLPFYGAGFTHHEGEFADTMARGLFYLGNRMVLTEHGGDFQEGSMYAQALSAIVFCEAYAMTGDENLRPFAQAAIDLIEWAQHPAGGWRYLPGQPGDTTSTGWQLMALKSGKLAGLRVSDEVLYNVTRFLESVQGDEGASYGYQTQVPRQSTTAIGLLCRMHTGWQRRHPALLRGARQLAEWGPAPDDLYYNYYATQVLNHLDGPDWPRWNAKLREQLIADQVREPGLEFGSWQYDNRHARPAGRLYHTAMAVMTLEVYYRYLPLYEATDEEGFTP